MPSLPVANHPTYPPVPTGVGFASQAYLPAAPVSMILGSPKTLSAPQHHVPEYIPAPLLAPAPAVIPAQTTAPEVDLTQSPPSTVSNPDHWAHRFSDPDPAKRNEAIRDYIQWSCSNPGKRSPSGVSEAFANLAGTPNPGYRTAAYVASHGAPPTITIQPASGRTSPAGIVPLGAPADPVALAAAGAVVAAKLATANALAQKAAAESNAANNARLAKTKSTNPDPNAIIVLGDSPAKVTVEEPVAPGAVKSQSRDPEYAWNLKVFAGDSAKSALSVTDWANIRASLLRRNWRMVKEGADVSQLQIFGYKYLANERPAYGLIAPKTSSGQVHFQALIKDIAIELKIAIRAWLPGERSQDFMTIKFPLDYAELSPEECMTSVEAFRPGLKGHWTVFASEDRPDRTGPGRNIVLLVNPEFLRELNKTPMRGLDSLAGELRIWRGQSKDDPELPNYALAAKSTSGTPSSTAKPGGAGRTSASGSTAKSGGPAKGGPAKGGAGSSASAAKTGPNAPGRGRGSGKGSSTVPKPHWCAEAAVAGPSKAAPAASASSSASRWNSVPKRKRSAGSTPDQGRKRSRKWDDAPAKSGGSQDQGSNRKSNSRRRRDSRRTAGSRSAPVRAEYDCVEDAEAAVPPHSKKSCAASTAAASMRRASRLRRKTF